jgi:hypothetical protein
MGIFKETKSEKVYTTAEKAVITEEFSPALAEVLETVAPALGYKVQILSRKALDVVALQAPEEDNRQSI